MESQEPRNFIRNIVEQDIASGKHKSVVTRFPPEPNGYLHIGHAKSICLNFGLAVSYQGRCHLRFDDTNPESEKVEYIESIKKDVQWLGFSWGEHLFHASDYFDQLYDYAEELIKIGKAYVCSLSADDTRLYRGTLTEGGKESPYRNRTTEENLDLFRRMRKGEFPDGAHVLRAKIDMKSGNINMRDPVIYRIKHSSHPMTGNKWCIYPMYDYTHCISDALEGITHSICTLEFEDHRPLYDWTLETLKTTGLMQSQSRRHPERSRGISTTQGDLSTALEVTEISNRSSQPDFASALLKTKCHPQQIEFSRLNLNYTVTSKRKLKELVEGGFVNGWDDPRMPTICGIRRRGYPPESLRVFCERIGVSKQDSVIDMALLEEACREQLNESAPRAFCVLDPIKVTLQNYPQGQIENLEILNHPQKPEMGKRTVPFGKELFIERADFMENPPKDFHRLAPGKKVRLRFSYIIECVEVKKDASGNVTELICNYDPDTLGKKPASGNVKGIIHWVEKTHAASAEIRLYERLLSCESVAQDESKPWTSNLNPHSLEVNTSAKLEPSLANAKVGAQFQFERLGYFTVDQDSTSQTLVFNRTVTLRDGWTHP